MSKLTRTLLIPLFALCIGSLMMMPAPPAKAQSVSVGADIMNRYVWRGQVLGSSAAVQPGLSYSQGGFTIGSWGSFSIDRSGTPGDELDLYASYTFDLGGSGALSVGVTDYYFPNMAQAPGVITGNSTNKGSEFFNYDEFDEGGAHTIEPNVSYTGPESLPISLYAAVNAYGTSARSTWLEASYPFSVKEVDLSVALGGAINDTDANFYFTNDDTDAGVMKASISASKSIEITDSFSLPITGTYYLNPYHEVSYFLFGISL